MTLFNMIPMCVYEAGHLVDESPKTIVSEDFVLSLKTLK